MNRRSILAGGCVFLLCGCNDDWERLKIIGKKLSDRAPQAGQVKDLDWREAGDMIRSTLTQHPLVHRVQIRLRLEKDLAKETIVPVLKGPGQIELTGSVATENQRARAGDVASRTVGVDEVVNSLTIGTGEKPAAPGEANHETSKETAKEGAEAAPEPAKNPGKESPIEQRKEK